MASMPHIAGTRHRFVEIETADSGPLNVHLYDGGAGNPVVMLHGWPQHAWCWRYVAPRLVEHHRVICPDLRGFGWSDAPGRGYDTETFASDAVALLDALGLERVNLVGHDWGGFAGFLLALRHPERVRRFLVLNTATPWIRPSPALLANAWRSWYAALNALPFTGYRLQRRAGWVRWILRSDAIHPGISPADAEVYAERLRRPESAHAARELYRSYWRLASDFGRPYDAMRLAVPTRLLFGTRDRFVTRHMVAGWEERADDMRVEWIADSGHFVQEEKPELVAERALELFA